MADLLSIGLSGLSATKTSLTVTGHNITNVNTPGYSRQDTTQATRTPQFSGAGYIGSGTSLTDIRRTYSEFLTTQLRSTTALNADAKSYLSQISQLDSLLAGSTTGVTPALQKFFAAAQTAAEDPANIPARQLMLSEAEGLARRFNTLHDSLSSQNDFANKQMQVVSEQVNRLAGSIGQLNQAIALASSSGAPPNDLLDARDEAVRQLSEYIGVTVVPQDDNSYNLFIGSGQPLVVGNTANRLEAVAGRSDPTRFEIDFVSGGSRQAITTQITGGELGGLIRYREDVLDSSLNALGRMAIAVSEEVNNQLGQGLDLKGNVGTALFKDLNSPELMALRVRAFSDNISQVSGSLSIDNSRLLHSSDYRLEFDGTNYKARRLSDNADITVDSSNFPELRFSDSAGRDQGFSVTLTGTPFAGDRLLLQPTRNGAFDIGTQLDQPDQLAFAAPLRGESNQQNRGTAQIGQPAIKAVLDPANPPVGFPNGSFVYDPLQQANISAFGQLSMRYDEASGELVFQTPLPAGMSITTAPPASAPLTSLPVVPGQNNTLSFAVQVTVGGVTQSYTIEQSFSGRPQDGDSFSLGLNDKGVSDNRNALELANLQNRAVIGVSSGAAGNTGMSFSDGYGDLVERVGTLTAQARMDNDATGTILKQATDNRDSLSGVNLDEEAANLIKFQQYYQASAQIIQTARSLFDTLIGAFR
ncbi:flagellar hook-associated protein FlgK [Ectopseudomonas mendocina]|uniref:Flagellar hook-associated protein 1 n=1 Tax=Ectopseudomonas mendocina TaxID=300 RepID=A0ABD7RUK7_ECTME|nr:flagellar hook-associated protein FlgK [Pseudomonas mendocina]TRO07478.1 flagellar hook-associated protein FlgK [Pseudomonas mendocina]TRO16540.1 flagellar hook-associated protein FlgK [Pseudomonas mendocina]